MSKLNSELVESYVVDDKITNVVLEKFYDPTDCTTVCKVKYMKYGRRKSVQVKIYDDEFFDGEYKYKLETLAEMM